MRKLYSLLFLITISQFASAGEPIDKSLEAAPEGKVLIDNVRGDIKVTAWKKSSVNVSGTLDDDAESFTFERSGDDITIHVKLERNKHHSGEGSKLTIQVPEKSQLELRGVSTNYSATGVLGGIQLKSVSGDFESSNITNGVSVTTVSGDINLKEISGSSKLETVSGDITAKLNSEMLITKTTSGNIRITNDKVKAMKVASVSGDIHIASNPVKDSEIDIHTVSGDVVFTFTGEPNTHINMHSVSGDKNSGLSSDNNVQFVASDKNSLQLKAGKGEGQMNIKTVSGDILLKSQ